ncbi:MAG TPA: CARDB domain-containing protein [Myxococcaceae bacterium]|nr:CARDB domain-containing protein [Myxococcaceae bacterium]
MSFLDEPDEPVRPRRRAPRGPSTDRQTLLLRRAIAVAGGVLVLILLIFGIRGCLNARAKDKLESYSNHSTELLRASKLESNALFKLLQSQGGTDQVVNIRNSLNGYRVESSELVDRAAGLDVPGSAKDAQRYLIEVLELRRDGLARTADAMQVALGDQNRREGTQNVSGAMQYFLASDVIQQARFQPTLNKALDDKDISRPSYPGPFIPDIQWLDPRFVSDQVNALRAGTGGKSGAATPGLHGNGLASVSLGGTTLTPGATASIPLTKDLSFSIQVQNQGQNTETDVNVKVSVGSGSDAIERQEPIDTIAAGENKTVTIPLGSQPPTGQNVPITVEVEPVPGEQKTDNNKQQFTVIFTR